MSNEFMAKLNAAIKLTDELSDTLETDDITITNLLVTAYESLTMAKTLINGRIN